MKPTYEELEAKCAALAAELSAVEEIHNEAVFITDEHYEQCPPEVQKMIRSLAVMQIPAYKSFWLKCGHRVWRCSQKSSVAELCFPTWLKKPQRNSLPSFAKECSHERNPVRLKRWRYIS